MKTWKRRWFILTDNCLYYFEYTTVRTGLGCALGPGRRGWGPGLLSLREEGLGVRIWKSEPCPTCIFRIRSPEESFPWKI